MNRTRKAGALVTSVVAVLGVSTILVHAAGATDTDDHASLASTNIYGIATGKPAPCPTTGAPSVYTTCFSVPGAAPTLTVYCNNARAGAKTPAATAGLVYFPLTILPSFHDGATGKCTDSLGGTEGTAVTQGVNGTKWQIKEVDKATDETTVEPNATGDKLTILVPKQSVVVTTSQGCKITVAPAGDTTVSGTYNDAGIVHIATTNLPVSIAKLATSCPLPTTASVFTTFYANYTFHLTSFTGAVAKLYDKG